MLRVVGADLERVRFQQIISRCVITMLVLDPAEQRELVIRAHVELERREPWPLAVVHPLGVMAVALAARLPVAFEERARVIRKWTEQLSATKVCRGDAHGHCKAADQLPFRTAPRHLCRPPVPPTARTRPHRAEIRTVW